MLHHCFSVFLLCVLQFVCCCLCCLYSPPRFWSCVPLLYSTCACHCVTFAPSLRLYLVFLLRPWCVCVVFFGVAVYFYCFWCCCGVVVQFSCGVSVLLLVCSGFVVCWVLLLVCGVCCCSSVGSVLFCCGPLFCGVLVASCVLLVCFGWSAVLLVGCRGCVALSAFLLLVVLLLLVVSPVRCTVLVLVAPGWFMRLVVVLLVVGLLVLLSPLFLVRHDQARLWSCSWFNAECHPGWVAVWCFCSCGLWEFVPFCCYYSDVVLSLWCVEFWVCGPALHCFQLSVWSSFLSCGCFCSVVVHCAWVVLSVPLYSPASFCSPASCCFCLFVVPCCSLVGCFVSC